MSEKRKLEEKDLKNIAGGDGEVQPLSTETPDRKRVVGGADEPDTNAQPGDNQNFSD